MTMVRYTTWEFDQNIALPLLSLLEILTAFRLFHNFLTELILQIKKGKSVFTQAYWEAERLV
jgi:hypothetical protein